MTWIFAESLTGKMIRANRIDWIKDLKYNHLIDVCKLVVNSFGSNNCKICNRNHTNQSALISDLQMHRDLTVEYFVDHVMVMEIMDY
jgi:hypothetical protein